MHLCVSSYCVASAKVLADLGQMELCREEQEQAGFQEAGSVSCGIHHFFPFLEASDDLEKLMTRVLETSGAKLL